MVPSSTLESIVKEGILTLIPAEQLVEHIRPAWLTSRDGKRLELDFYIPSLEIAVEVQGLQHYVPNPHHFKTLEDFERYRQAGFTKRERCVKNNVALVEISGPTELEEGLLKLIRMRLDRRNSLAKILDPNFRPSICKEIKRLTRVLCLHDKNKRAHRQALEGLTPDQTIFYRTAIKLAEEEDLYTITQKKLEAIILHSSRDYHERLIERAARGIAL